MSQARVRRESLQAGLVGVRIDGSARHNYYDHIYHND